MKESANQKLKRAAIKSGTHTIAEQLVRVVVQIAQLYVLGRLLEVEDYGLVMMVQAFTGFTAVLRDFGFSSASIQAKDLTEQQSSNLFWLGLGVSVFIAIIVALMSPLVVWFYGKPRLFWLVMAGAITPLLSGLAGQPVALLKRNMQFGLLAVVRLISMLFSFGVAVVLALLEFGPWALMCGTLANASVIAIGSFLASGFWPKLYQKSSGTRSLVEYGGLFTAGNAFGYLGRNLDNFMIGSFFGDTALGLYSRAYALLMLPVSQLQGAIGQVNFVAFSKLQHDKEKFKSAAIRLLNVYLFVSTIVVVPIVCCSTDIIVVVLGDKWAGAGRVFLCLTPIAWVQLAGSVCTLTFTASGNVSAFTRWSLVNNVFAIVGILCGLPWGVEGVALSYSLSGLLLRYPYLVHSTNSTGYLDTQNLLATVGTHAAVAMVPLVLGLVCSSWIADLDPHFRLCVVGLVTTFSFVLAASLTKRGRKSIYEIVQVVRMILRKTQSSSAAPSADPS